MYRNDEINWVKFLLNKRIYIFGAGFMGKKLYAMFCREGDYDICSFIDNKKSVLNKDRIENLEVISLEEYKLRRTNSDWIVISTSINDIEMQLLNEGIYSFVDYMKLDFNGLNAIDRYDEKYFSLQIDFARVDSELDKDFFQPYIKESDRVAEFGMGGGLLLNKLRCKTKIGIEINPYAREYARTNGIESVSTVEELSDNSLDVVISTHALEHCLKPYEIICEIRKKLVDGGKAIFVVPYDSLEDEYLRGDNAYHVFTWNQRTIANLFKLSGYFIRETGIKEVAWPRNWQEMYSNEKKDWFNALSVLESHRTGYYSVYLVAEK